MGRGRSFLCALSFLLVFSASSIHASPDPSQTDALGWLTSMRQASSQMNYKGIMAYSKNGQVESFQLFHSMREGVERERLVSMNSPLREVIRNAEKVVCYYPETRTAFVENKPSRHSMLLDLPEDLSKLTQYYRFSLQDREYVTNRQAQAISIIPKDDYRYARRIWLDVESRLPLKSELIDETGANVEQMVFTTLDIAARINREELETSIPEDSVKWMVSQREMLSPASLNWSLERVPEGFQMISYTRMKRHGEETPLDHLLLSDGLSSVSIYIDESRTDILKSHPRKVGALNAASRKIGSYQVTVMGEVPERTVQAIAEGLRYQDPSNHD